MGDFIFSWNDVQTRRADVDAASAAGDEWATGWLLFELRVWAFYQRRTLSYPEWFVPSPKSRRIENRHRFDDELQQRRRALFARVGVTRDTPFDGIRNPFIAYLFWMGSSLGSGTDGWMGPVELRTWKKEKLDAALDEGCVAAAAELVLILSPTGSRQLKLARRAAAGGFPEHVLWVASALYESFHQGELERGGSLAHHRQRARELCQIVGEAGDPDGFVMMDDLQQAVEMGSLLGMRLLGHDLLDKALRRLPTTPPIDLYSMEEAEELAEEARKLLVPVAAQGWEGALLDLADLEERFGRRKEARAYYEKAWSCASCSETRVHARAGMKRTRWSPFHR